MASSTSTTRLSLAFVLAALFQGALAQNCDPGTYSTTGTTPCTQCPVGTFQSNSSATSCQEADAGYYASGLGATTETICGDGYYSIGGTESCTPCPDDATCAGEGNTGPVYTPSVTTDGGVYQGSSYVPDYQEFDNTDDFDGFISPIDFDDLGDDLPTHTKREPKMKKKTSPSPSAVFKRATKKKSSASPSAVAKRATKKSKKLAPSPSAVVKRATKKAKKVTPSPSAVFKREPKKAKPTPSPSAVSKREEYPMLAPISSCRPGFQDCPINGVLAYTDDFECVDIRNSLESCGGCVADDSPNGEYNIDGGRDCSSIPNVDSVLCSKAQCVIASCNSGYAVSSDGTRCAPVF